MGTCELVNVCARVCVCVYVCVCIRMCVDVRAYMRSCGCRCVYSHSRELIADVQMYINAVVLYVYNTLLLCSGIYYEISIVALW